MYYRMAGNFRECQFAWKAARTYGLCILGLGHVRASDDRLSYSASCRSYTVSWAIAQATESYSIDSRVQGYAMIYGRKSEGEDLDGHAADPYDMLLGSRTPSAGRQ